MNNIRQSKSTSGRTKQQQRETITPAALIQKMSSMEAELVRLKMLLQQQEERARTSQDIAKMFLQQQEESARTSQDAAKKMMASAASLFDDCKKIVISEVREFVAQRLVHSYNFEYFKFSNSAVTYFILYHFYILHKIMKDGEKGQK